MEGRGKFSNLARDTLVFCLACYGSIIAFGRIDASLVIFEGIFSFWATYAGIGLGFPCLRILHCPIWAKSALGELLLNIASFGAIIQT